MKRENLQNECKRNGNKSVCTSVNHLNLWINAPHSTARNFMHAEIINLDDLEHLNNCHFPPTKLKFLPPEKFFPLVHICYASSERQYSASSEMHKLFCKDCSSFHLHDCLMGCLITNSRRKLPDRKSFAANWNWKSLNA